MGLGAAALPAGKYAEAAAKGRELIEERPDQPYLYFNTACCESLAGEAAQAVEHLRRAIDMWEGCRELAQHDSDFDPIRDEPAFELCSASRAGWTSTSSSGVTTHAAPG